MNVFLVLTIGIFASGLIGLATGSIDIFTLSQSIYSGFTGMNEVFFLTLFCSGMSALITYNGGIAWLISTLKKTIKGNKSAQLGIISLVSLADCATANNTVAIVISGSMAKDISQEFKVDPRKTASLLDIFSCVVQGMIPYGAQLLVAASLANVYGIMIAPIDIIPNIWYCMILAVFGIVSIFVPLKEDWDFENHCPKARD